MGNLVEDIFQAGADLVDGIVGVVVILHTLSRSDGVWI